MSTTFEGSYLGDATRLADDTRLECGICWYVYDPVIGDEVAQIAPGTPFSKLPQHWRCPNCDAEKQKFMVIAAVSDGGHDVPRVERLEASFRKVAASMHGLPIYHPALTVEAVGFREHESRLIGVLVTPWFMNVVALPAASDVEVWRSGATLRLGFPSGHYDFLVSNIDDFGLIASCSLFSPMSDFADQDAARTAAQAAADGLFEPDEPDTAEQSAPELSRRQLLQGGGTST